MGKRQHQKDKMYLTYTEWTTLYGGKRSGTPKEEDTTFKRLPFDHCCLCLQPFEDPYCDSDGNIFELQAILEFVKKFKVNPVTGKALLNIVKESVSQKVEASCPFQNVDLDGEERARNSKDTLLNIEMTKSRKQDVKTLTKLNFFKNAEGHYHCAVLFKPFTKNSYIVAIKTSGNVYSNEAVEQLNIKGKNWKDLINDTPFARTDIIVIQDPNNLDKFNISTFHHIKNNLRVETEDKFNAAHYSTGMVAASFTSTAMMPETVHEAAIICEDDVKYDMVKKKGYVRLVTNLGPLNFELYCDLTPKACDNFIRHCNNGYYNGTKFHRSIRNFMIQGGDPTGTGLGGESVWKKPFEDEVKPNLHHTGRGVLSLANSGPNTNGSQFFITFRSCKQLDGKHTIFGKLVGGMDTLTAMEQIEVDNKDRPIQDIVIDVAQVFVDPFAEAEEQLVKDRAEELKRKAETEGSQVRPKKAKQPLKVFRDGVGKYLNLQEVAPPAPTSSKSTKTQEGPAKKVKKDGKFGFGGFDSW